MIKDNISYVHNPCAVPSSVLGVSHVQGTLLHIELMIAQSSSHYNTQSLRKVQCTCLGNSAL